MVLVLLPEPKSVAPLLAPPPNVLDFWPKLKPLEVLLFEPKPPLPKPPDVPAFVEPNILLPVEAGAPKVDLLLPKREDVLLLEPNPDQRVVSKNLVYETDSKDKDEWLEASEAVGCWCSCQSK